MNQTTSALEDDVGHGEMRPTVNGAKARPVARGGAPETKRGGRSRRWRAPFFGWGLSMIRLTDERLTIVMDGARPLRLGDRDPFLLLVAEQLQGLPAVGNADVRRAVQTAQRQYWDPPQLNNQPGHRAAMRGR
jgi:hypothetical protein